MPPLMWLMGSVHWPVFTLMLDGVLGLFVIDGLAREFAERAEFDEQCANLGGICDVTANGSGL
jgi:hypothetical protein